MTNLGPSAREGTIARLAHNSIRVRKARRFRYARPWVWPPAVRPGPCCFAGHQSVPYEKTGGTADHMSSHDEPVVPPKSSDVVAQLVEHWRQPKQRTVARTIHMPVEWRNAPSPQVIQPTGIPPEEVVGTPRLVTYPDILLQATVLVFGDRTDEGRLIQEVGIAWFEIIRQLERDPDFLFRIPWPTLEEIIAGAYERAGFPEVILTPRSGDRGRDVIATRPGIGSIRIVDQVKAYHPGHRVSADEVRSLLGVLQVEPNVSKGVITTTSQFAPGIYRDERLCAFIPYRLELKDGPQLLRWLRELLLDGPAPP